MAATASEELLELTRLFSAHAAWQRELGATSVPSRASPAALTPSARLREQSPREPGVPHLALRVPVPVAMTPLREVITTEEIQAPGPSLSSVNSTPGLGPEGSFEAQGGERVRRLAVIAQEVNACRACKLGNTRKNTVFSRGNPFARLFFLGEGPGEQEDLQGLPFVGPAGQLLDRIITRGMGLDPARDVYIGNIVKCRPPSNRVPEPDEMAACTPFLVRQLDLVRPEVIVALGRTAVSFLLDTRESMTRLRGKWRSYHGIAVMPTWHPSYLLRTPEAKADTWADVKLVLERLGIAAPVKNT